MSSCSQLQELPAPPVPDLGLTLTRYLEALTPVVPDLQQLRTTEQLVKKFGDAGGVGDKLQRHLLNYAASVDNWVTPLWLEDMYLKNPVPLPVNSNPFFLLPKRSLKNKADQLRLAGQIVQFSVLFKRRLYSSQFQPDTASGHGKGAPLCMSTYYHFFTSYRRPKLGKDELIVYDEPASHFIVAFNSQFYVLHLPKDDLIPSLDSIVKALEHITTNETEEQAPVGILTTESRDVWSQAREALVKDELNQRNIELIEQSEWILCLDSSVPGVPSYSTIRKESITLDIAAMAAHILHGSGTDQASCNRWYDKFLQVILTLDGVCGMVVEHSASEGISVLRYCQELLEWLENPALQDCSEDQIIWEHLKWNISTEIAETISTAKQKINKLVSDLDLFILKFNEYGKDFIKSKKISPDVYIQLALQLTYYKVHKKLVSTYESASLRQFKHGRVDNIRAATKEALAWVKAMCDVTEEDKLTLFRWAVKKQTEVLLYTINGHGPDNHLMALREMAAQSGEPEPELFQDKSYKTFLDFRLSTSQLPTDTGSLVGYGPVTLDGYGCSYTPCPNHIDFCVSSFYSSPETSSDFLALSLEGSLLQMRELVANL